MKFCENCDFMLYIKLTEDNKLAYKCKHCGFEKDHNSEDIDNCIYSKDYKINEVSYSWMVNPDLCHDPTLPRVGNIPCPNDKINEETGEYLCPTKTTLKKPNEVIYVLFDKKNLKYFYMCCHCHSTWKHE